jgi:hypothetical protein
LNSLLSEEKTFGFRGYHSVCACAFVRASLIPVSNQATDINFREILTPQIHTFADVSLFYTKYERYNIQLGADSL